MDPYAHTDLHPNRDIHIKARAYRAPNTDFYTYAYLDGDADPLRYPYIYPYAFFYAKPDPANRLTA